MPNQLSDEEVVAFIQEAITTLQITTKKEFGKVMGYVMPKVKGKADGTKVQQLVQKTLKEFN
jgi:uncharacterized protein YqeY